LLNNKQALPYLAKTSTKCYYSPEEATVSYFLDRQFTGHEKDDETGLYYFGARYLNPQTSMWLSADPAMGEYVPGAPINDEVRKSNQNLPGMGGVFNAVNLHTYHYAGNNPVKYTDPDGRFINLWAGVKFYTREYVLNDYNYIKSFFDQYHDNLKQSQTKQGQGEVISTARTLLSTVIDTATGATTGLINAVRGARESETKQYGEVLDGIFYSVLTDHDLSSKWQSGEYQVNVTEDRRVSANGNYSTFTFSLVDSTSGDTIKEMGVLETRNGELSLISPFLKEEAYRGEAHPSSKPSDYY
jgi:RHS repeat-associated protein